MNKYDKKNRPEVGVQDMENYEYGGLEVDENLANGYQLYVPYGVHVALFDAIEHGLDALREKVAERKETIRYLNHQHKKDDYTEVLIEQIKEHITKIEKDIAMLEKVLPISDTI